MSEDFDRNKLASMISGLGLEQGAEKLAKVDFPSNLIWLRSLIEDRAKMKLYGEGFFGKLEGILKKRKVLVAPFEAPSGNRDLANLSAVDNTAKGETITRKVEEINRLAQDALSAWKALVAKGLSRVQQEKQAVVLAEDFQQNLLTAYTEIAKLVGYEDETIHF